MKKILSLDQSTSNVGFAIFEDGELKDYGCIRYSKKINSNNMYSIFLKTVEKIENEKPDIVLIEDVYAKKMPIYNKKTKKIIMEYNIQTHKKLANLQGMFISYFILHQIDFEIVAPKTWQKVVKSGTVKKEDTLSFVNKKYSINLKNDNIADSICIGLSYISVCENL